MNYRRILYIAFIVFVALFLFRTLEDDNGIDKQQQYLTKVSVMESILDSELNQDTTSIYFPLNYNGYNGEVFYVCAENMNGPITYKYRIEEIGDKEIKELQFKLEQTWEGIKIPADKFNAYHIEDGQFVEL